LLNLRDPVQFSVIFFFNTPSTTDIYTLSLHDALPIYAVFKTLDNELQLKVRLNNQTSNQLLSDLMNFGEVTHFVEEIPSINDILDRKSTRLNSSHVKISYAVFCLKKKKKK